MRSGHRDASQAGTASGSKSGLTIVDQPAPAQPLAVLESSGACPAPPQQLEVSGVVTSPPSGAIRDVNLQSHPNCAAITESKAGCEVPGLTNCGAVFNISR